MNSVFRHVQVQGLVVTVPAHSIDIHEELEFFGGDRRKLERTIRMVGYGTRHVVEDGVTALDLCEHAAHHLMRAMGDETRDIDTLLVVEQSPDYLQPSDACLLQNRLGLPRDVAALNTIQGCSGYVQGLWLAHSLIASNASTKVLLLAGDAPSTHSNRRNRLVNPIFGDAGSATLLARCEEDNTAYFHLGTDGSGWSDIAIPAGGARLPLDTDILEQTLTDAAGNPWRLCDAIISGMPIFDFSVHTVPEAVARVLELAGMRIEDLNFIAMHQANKQILDEIAQRLNLGSGGLYTGTFSRYGNQSTASVAGVLADVFGGRMADKISTVLLCGFGIGLSWASAILRFVHCHNMGVIIYEADGKAWSREDQCAFWKKKFLRS
ncbi:MAG: ketoacyl-ACP synthase III [Desulfovibrionaceae bacterium]|nr:ketoacyl-ACP synthase III [Desulfovibrionaceae bacterium]